MHTDNEDDINKAIDILKKNKSIDYAAKKSKAIMEKAWKNLDKKIPEGDAKRNLEKLSRFLIERNLWIIDKYLDIPLSLI